MKILGIDPGIGRCGWAVVTVESSKFKVVSYGCVETSPKSADEHRLKELYSLMIQIIRLHKPDVLAIEELFFGANTKTAMVVGQARGVILLAASQKDIPVAVYTPLQVKVAVSGYGRAEKTQMGKMVQMILTLDKIPKPDDTVDALAIAITHAFSYKMNML